jgi:hypothetical protein
MADEKVKGKKGVVKSILSLDVPNLIRNFKEKPTRTVIKSAIVGTPLQGMAEEIYSQFQSGDFDLAKIIGSGVKKTKKRVGQVYDFGQDVAKNMNMGGMAEARKKNMGLKMKRGGSVKKRAKSSSKKSRGTGAAIKGTKFKGVF